jgi:hypothetical protein
MKPGDLVKVRHRSWHGKCFFVFRIDTRPPPLTTQYWVFHDSEILVLDRYDLELFDETR